MRTALIVAAAACLLAGAFAECPNACSGHGLCSTSTDHCECFAGWEPNDCSQRSCPFGNAFADTPNGDLNYDGALDDAVSFTSSEFTFQYWETRATQQFGLKSSTEEGSAPTSRPNSASPKVQDNEGHFWKRCSGRGRCDAATGSCQCDEGYEGVACQRQACAGGCNGHGRCMNMREAAILNSQSYDLWDARKNQVCVCDRGYSGVDCTDRLCPKGDDPLDGAGTNEVQTVEVGCTAGTQAGGFFRLNITDYHGFVWQTGMVPFYEVSASRGTNLWTAAEAAGNMTAALNGIPNDVFSDVVVTAISAAGGVGTQFSITFPTVGDYDVVAIDKFYSLASSDDSTCQALTATTDTNAIGTVATPTAGTANQLTECSSRGLCDYTTGACKCFAGYTGDDCSQQNALAESSGSSRSFTSTTN